MRDCREEKQTWIKILVWDEEEQGIEREGNRENRYAGKMAENHLQERALQAGLRRSGCRRKTGQMRVR
jgi:hypothetical protein